jgi:hypothetical protein
MENLMKASELSLIIRSRKDRFWSGSVFFLLVIACALSACVLTNGRTTRNLEKGKTGVSQGNANSQPVAEHELEFAVTTEDRQWPKESPRLVRLRIHNSATVEFSGICAFTLTSKTKHESGSDWYSFWAPVRLQGSGAEPMRGPFPSKIEKDQQFEVAVDVSKLKWGRLVQAVWPNSTLSDIVPAGEYDFYFDMALGAGDSKKHIESNKVVVSIR